MYKVFGENKVSDREMHSVELDQGSDRGDVTVLFFYYINDVRGKGDIEQMRRYIIKNNQVMSIVILLTLAIALSACSEPTSKSASEQKQTANSTSTTQQTTNVSPETSTAITDDGVTAVALNKTLDEFVAEQKKTAAPTSNAQENITVQDSGTSQADSNSSPANTSNSNAQGSNETISNNTQASSVAPALNIT
jgi:hypothetical protein